MVAGATLLPATSAFAAPGDASAQGVFINLSAQVQAVTVISANATIGTATAPPGGGTDSSTLLPVTLVGATNVAASGTVDEVTATRGPISSSASATVSNFGLNVLGVNTLTAAQATATVSCPFAGAQSADTTVSGLQLFGSAISPTVNGPAVTLSTGVTVTGLVGGTLTGSVSRVETVSANAATASAVLATFVLTGTVGGQPVVIPAGNATLAQATCERPASAAAPTAASIVPNAGPQSGGQTVTITGTNFIDGGTTVAFDGAPATNVVVAPGGASLTAVTPPGAVGPAVAVVTTAGGDAPPLDYTYLADGSAANVTSLSPDVGPTIGGTLVTITGSGFTGATAVTFDGGPGTDFTVDPSGTTITVVTPAHTAGPVPVTLVFPAGTAPAGNFTYVAPAVASVTPNQGPTTGGTTVTITGTGFTGATGVTFDGQPGTGLVVNPSGTSLTVTTPPGSVGPADVVVEVPGQNATDPGGFTYVAAAPTIGSLDPGQGPVGGGTTVTITGSGFVPGQTTVSICDRQIPAGNVTVDPSGLSLTFVTPPCQAGSATVTVTTPAGTSNGLTFRYVGGSLPVTGTPVALYLAAGLLMLGVGSVGLILARHHR